MNQDTEDYKIWFPHEVFYIESMLTITRTAMNDQSALRTIIEDISKGKEYDQHLIIDLVQNIITHAASISKYFWPIQKDKIHKKRGQRLREAFEIQESNPIKDRKVRDFIEHFDENLDKFLQNMVSGQFIPIYVGTRVTFENNPIHLFRAYFVDDWTFHALGQEFRLVEIINELVRIHLLLDKFSKNGGRLPS